MKTQVLVQAQERVRVRARARARARVLVLGFDFGFGCAGLIFVEAPVVFVLEVELVLMYVWYG